MLIVSREDVAYTFITEFPATERFIKLPVENYLKLMPAPVGISGSVFDNLNRPQIALINAINDPKYRFVVAALSRRLGKTFMANLIGQLVVLIPGCNVLIMSPNYGLSSISFELQRKFIKHFDIEVEKNNLKDKIVELENGSTIRMGSINTVDSCVGRSYNLIVFDEAALGADAENAWNVSLRPTLDRPGSKAIFISTPRGKLNWFARFWERGFLAEFPEWVSLQADYKENTRMSEKDVDEARRSMTKAEFEQEYMASFNSFEGQIYNYNSELCTVEYERSDGDESIGGLDPGYRDPTAFAVIVYCPKENLFHIVDEYVKAEAVTSGHASVIGSFVEQWSIDPIFIDSAAAQFAADLAYTYDIATIKAKKAVNDGIAFVQVIVEQNRLRVSPHCVHTLAMLSQYQWDRRENLIIEKPQHDTHSHIADAIRYALYSYVT